MNRTDVAAIERDLTTLNAQHVAALDALDRGDTYAAAAEAAGRSERTVRRWATSCPAFIAERNRRRAVLLDESADAFGALVRAALRVVQHAVDDEDRGAAMTVLHLLPADVIRASLNPGPTSAVEILDARSLAVSSADLDATDPLSATDDLAYVGPTLPADAIRRRRVAVRRLVQDLGADEE